MAQYNIQDCCDSDNIMQVDNITGTFSTGDILFFVATGFTTPGSLDYSFTGCGTVTLNTPITSTLTATTNTTAYTDCYTCDLLNTGATSCDCTCAATSQVTLTSNNYTGQIAQITFSAQTGGTYNLGNQLVPYIYDSCNFLGEYDLYFSAFNKTCSVTFTGFSDCDVWLVSDITFNPISGIYQHKIHKYEPYSNKVVPNVTGFQATSGITSAGFFDIASTKSKIWGQATTLAPGPYIATGFTQYEWYWLPQQSGFPLFGTYSTIRRPIDIYLSGGTLGRSLTAINDRYFAFTWDDNTDGLTKISLADTSGSTASTISSTIKIVLPGIYTDVGDMIYTSQGKMIVSVWDGNGSFPNSYAILQYDFLSGTFECSGTTPNYNLNAGFEYNNTIYFVDYNTNNLYSASTTTPYTLTLVQSQILNIASYGNIVGASSSPCCSTISLTP